MKWITRWEKTVAETALLMVAVGMAAWIVVGAVESRAAGEDGSGRFLVAAQSAQSGRPFTFVSPGEKARVLYEPKHGEGLVRILFRGFLNREPGREELAYWRGRLRSGDDRTNLVREFINTDEVFVRRLYLGLLGREPDPGGFDQFTRELKAGRSREDVMDAFIYSQELAGRLR